MTGKRKLPALEVRGAATVCPRCATDNLPGAKFCMECGSALSSTCPDCGSATTPGQNFCTECGLALSPRSSTAQVPPRAPSETTRAPTRAAPQRDSAELRTVSV